MKPYYSFLVLLIGVIPTLKSQNYENVGSVKSDYLKSYDSIVGLENTGFYNGIQFYDQSRSADGTFRFYNDFEFSRGSVVFNGQFYNNVLLKYDLLEDLLITHSEGDLNIFHVQLVPEKVENFSINSKNFVRLDITDPKVSKGNDFYEILYKGSSYNLYQKHYKDRSEVLKGTFIAYSYDKEIFFLLEYNGNFNIIESIKDCRKALPEKKEAINDFYSIYKNLYNTDKEKFMLRLFKTLDNNNLN